MTVERSEQEILNRLFFKYFVESFEETNSFEDKNIDDSVTTLV